MLTILTIFCRVTFLPLLALLTVFIVLPVPSIVEPTCVLTRFFVLLLIVLVCLTIIFISFGCVDRIG